VRRSIEIRNLCRGLRVLFCPAALPLFRQSLDDAAGIIRRHRRKTGSCWRKLSPGRQALLVLVCLRNGETPAGLAAGFGIGTATAWRYVAETVALLAARALQLRRALAKPKLRLIRQAIWILTCGFAGLAGWRSGYFKVSGTGTPRRRKASRWALLGSASIGTSARVPVNRTWLRVRVARWSSRPRKLW